MHCSFGRNNCRSKLHPTVLDSNSSDDASRRRQCKLHGKPTIYPCVTITNYVQNNFASLTGRSPKCQPAVPCPGRFFRQYYLGLQRSELFGWTAERPEHGPQRGPFASRFPQKRAAGFCRKALGPSLDRIRRTKPWIRKSISLAIT